METELTKKWKPVLGYCSEEVKSLPPIQWETIAGILEKWENILSPGGVSDMDKLCIIIPSIRRSLEEPTIELVNGEEHYVMDAYSNYVEENVIIAIPTKGELVKVDYTSAYGKHQSFYVLIKEGGEWKERPF